MCSSGTDKTCISYFDGIQNGAETDVDCGNSPAHPCADMKMCNAHSDCKSNFCLLAPGADGSAFHLQGLCVTRVTARLSIPPLADPSPGAECQTVTDGVAAVPSIPNASGWQFCKLQASVYVHGGATLSLVDPSATQVSRGLVQESTSSLTFEGYPYQVSDFLSRQIQFCPSCVPQDYRMTIHIRSSGDSALSPCPTTSLQPVVRIVRSSAAYAQEVKFVVRDASCTSNNTCATGASTLKGATVRVNAGNCFRKKRTTERGGRVKFSVPLRDAARPVPALLNITVSKPGYAPVTLLQARFSGKIDLGDVFLVRADIAAMFPNPSVTGKILDASTNSPVSADITGLVVQAYRGFGVQVGDTNAGALLVADATPDVATGQFSLPDLAPGVYTVIVSAGSSYHALSLNTLWNAQGLQFLLSPTDLAPGQMRLVLS
jgi:hypothetical protein